MGLWIANSVRGELRSIAGIAAAASMASRRRSSGAGSKMKNVLVVDDSATMRRMVISSLRSIEQVAFLEAANGLEAIEKLAISPVDLMILDLNMPDMHGMEVVAFVTKAGDFPRPPNYSANNAWR